jgi:hypothetical protein
VPGRLTGDPELTGRDSGYFQYSGGVPRHINKMCTRLLLYGFLQSQHILDKEDVECVARELDEEYLSPVGNGQSSPGDAEGDAGAVSLRDESLSLSDLEVRAPQGAGDALPPSAPPETGKSAAASIPRSEPGPAATARVAPQRPRPKGYVKPDSGQPPRAVIGADQHRGSMPAVRLLPSLFKLQEIPAVLLGVVVAVTVTSGTGPVSSAMSLNKVVCLS